MTKKVSGETEDRLLFRNEALARFIGLVAFACSWAPTIAIVLLPQSTSGMTEDAKIWNARLFGLAVGAIIALPAPCMYFALLCFSVRVVTAICIAIPYTGLVWIATFVLLLSMYGFNV